MAWTGSDWANVAASAVSGVTGVVGALGRGKKARQWYNSAYSKGGLMDQYQRRIEERARKYAMEDWQRDAEYNSPANQRRLLEEAGLNTALMYGNSMPGGSAPSISETSAGDASVDTSFGEFQSRGYQDAWNSVGTAIREGMMYQLQNSKLLKDLEYSNNQIEIQRDKLNLDKDRLDWDKEKTNLQLEEQRRMNDSRISKIESDIVRNDVATEFARMKIKGYEELQPYVRERLIQDIANKRIVYDQMVWDYSQRYEREALSQQGKQSNILADTESALYTQSRRIAQDLKNDIDKILPSGYVAFKREVYDWIDKVFDVGNKVQSMRLSGKRISSYY